MVNITYVIHQGNLEMMNGIRFMNYIKGLCKPFYDYTNTHTLPMVCVKK